MIEQRDTGSTSILKIITISTRTHSSSAYPISRICQPGLTGDCNEELIREQLARNYAFFGEDGMAKVREGRVVVVGCGGVGSWAAVMLVRS